MKKQREHISPAVETILRYLDDIDLPANGPSEAETRMMSIDAMDRNGISMPLNVDEASIWLLLIHNRATAQVCNTAWSYYADFINAQNIRVQSPRS